MNYSERRVAWKNWKVGDLVFCNYKNRYYGEILSIEGTGTPGSPYYDPDHRIVTVRRLYDEYGEPAISKGKHSYDSGYLTKVDKEYVKLQKKRFDRVVELYEEHNG